MSTVETPATTAHPRALLIAAALVTLELIGGMQIYLSGTILPVIAAELGGRRWYGSVTGISLVAQFIGMPSGAVLLARVRLSRLLVASTLLIVIGAVTSALAPAMGVFVLGQGLRSLGGGVMAVVTMGAVVRALPPRVRRVTLALTSATWIASSVLGPIYAAGLTHALSWRWAMLVYLPLLLAGRWVVAMNVPHAADAPGRPGASGGAGWVGALLLGSGAGLLALSPAFRSPPVACAQVLGGCILLLLGARAVLPPGTLRELLPHRGHRGRIGFLAAAGAGTGDPAEAGGRRAAIAAMLLLPGAYFAADVALPILAHDLLGLGVAGIGAILMAGGLAWALVGLLVGARPARSAHGVRRRIVAGAGLLALADTGIALVLLAPPLRAVLQAHPAAVLAGLWALGGIGMGLAYLEVMNRVFEGDASLDGIAPEQAASAVVLAESIGAAIGTGLSTTFLATGLGWGSPGLLGAGIGTSVLTLATLALIPLGVRAARPPTTVVP